MPKKELSKMELDVIHNIRTKLEIYMEKNNQSLFALASAFGFEYQPVQRLMKGSNTPNISSMSMIAENLNCTISELISDQMLINIKLVDSYQDFIDQNINEVADVYININEYMRKIDSDFFAISSNITNEEEQPKRYRLYSTCSEIVKEGVYLVEYENKLLELNVISTSSQFIISEKNKVEQRIYQKDISPKAEFISKLIIFGSKCKYLTGVKK